MQRLAHLLMGAALLVYVYGAPTLGTGFTTAVRWIALPVLALSGIALWKWPQRRRLLRRRGLGG